MIKLDFLQEVCILKFVIDYVKVIYRIMDD